MIPERGPSGTEMLAVGLVDTTDGLERLRADWQRLFAESRCTNPFARWEWTYRWWQIFGRQHGPIRDKLHMLVHYNEQGIHGISPFIQTVFQYGPLKISKLRNPGSVPGAYVTEMYPYIWSPSMEEPVAHSLVEALERQSANYVVELNSVPLDRPFGAVVQRSRVGRRATWLQPTPYFPLPVTADWQSLRKRLSANHREYLRQQAKRLERLEGEGHRCQFEIVEDRRLMPAALDDFFRLHRARSQMVPDPNLDAYHPDYFSSPQAQTFLRAVAEDLCGSGGFRIARLVVDDETVACRVLLPVHDHLFLYYSGYDPRWRHYSVMGIVTTKVIQAAIADENTMVVNLSTNVDRSKARWKPEEGHWLGNLRIVAPTVAGRLGYTLQRAAPLLRDSLESGGRWLH
jgi:CelD/BcsL family acetyltransferase involved in cellulose biosynthesis